MGKVLALILNTGRRSAPADSPCTCPFVLTALRMIVVSTTGSAMPPSTLWMRARAIGG